jgi:hypothetical protein
MNARIWVFGVLLVAALGCGGGGGDNGSDNAGTLDGGGGIATCVPGKTDLCACAGGKSGVQTCRPDSTFAPCECAGGSDASLSDASGNASTHDDGGGDSSNASTHDGGGADISNPSTDDGGGDRGIANPLCDQPGRICTCDGGQMGVQGPGPEPLTFAPCACPRGSDAGVSDASTPVTCTSGGKGDVSLSCYAPGIVVCALVYNGCSDGQRYTVTCVAEQDNSVTCQCDVSGSGGIAYHTGSCPDFPRPLDGGASVSTSCGWNMAF